MFLEDATSVLTGYTKTPRFITKAKGVLNYKQALYLSEQLNGKAILTHAHAGERFAAPVPHQPQVNGLLWQQIERR